jgi:cytochrome c oxidase subunit 3
MYELQSEAELASSDAAVTPRQLGLWAFLATVTMLFAGFTSAILVRRTAADWPMLPLPSLLWVNSVVLLVSSVAMEAVRRASRQDQCREVRRWLIVVVALGAVFLIGQLGAWRQLAAQGVFLPSNPHSSFFYILTGVHGVHLLGGIVGLFYLVVATSRRMSAPLSTVNLFATYWHFVGGLWVYLFVVLFVL